MKSVYVKEPLLLLAFVAICVLAGCGISSQQKSLNEAGRAFKDGNLKTAAQKYDHVIRSWPNEVSAVAYGQRAAIFVTEQKYKEGLRFVADALTIHPDRAEVLEQKALLLWALQQRTKAISVAENVVEKRRHTFSNQKLLCTFYAARNPGKAISSCEAYLRHRPAEHGKQDARVLVHLGYSYLDVAAALDRDNKVRRRREHVRRARRTLSCRVC